MFRKMRRFKQLLAQEQILEILNGNTSGTLALLGDMDYPYAVPLNYVYFKEKLYFHSANRGHKIDAILNHHKVSFCIIDQDHILPEKYTSHFRSVIAFGTARIITNPEEIRPLATALGMKYCSAFQEGIQAEIDSAISHMVMIEMTIDSITGKEALVG